MILKIGDKVKLKKGAPLYKSSTSIIPSSFLKEDKITYITRIAIGTKHPYNTTGDLGWMNESDIELDDPKEKYEVEIELIDKDNVIDYIKEHPDKVVIMNGEQLKDVFNL